MRRNKCTLLWRGVSLAANGKWQKRVECVFDMGKSTILVLTFDEVFTVGRSRLERCAEHGLHWCSWTRFRTARYLFFYAVYDRDLIHPQRSEFGRQVCLREAKPDDIDVHGIYASHWTLVVSNLSPESWRRGFTTARHHALRSFRLVLVR